MPRRKVDPDPDAQYVYKTENTVGFLGAELGRFTDRWVTDSLAVFLCAALWFKAPEVRRYQRRKTYSIYCPRRHLIILAQDETSLVIVHEMAHALAMQKEYRETGVIIQPAHGPEFRKAYVQLAEAISPVWSVRLSLAFRQAGLHLSRRDILKLGKKS